MVLDGFLEADYLVSMPDSSLPFDGRQYNAYGYLKCEGGTVEPVGYCCELKDTRSACKRRFLAVTCMDINFTVAQICAER